MTSTPEKPKLDATGRDPLVFYLFDVDGTLTEVRKTISREMMEFMMEIKKKVYCGIVSGSDLDNVNQQLRGSAIEKFDYVFSENGLTYHRNGKICNKTNICTYLGEEKLQEVLDFCLKYLSELKLPIKRGQFLELRSGLINVCPMGRNCSNEEREIFIAYDKENHVRENFIAELSQKFNDVGLVYSRGGQISFDIYPRGWNKRYCLDHIDSDGFEDIHFFGDRCEPGGTDYDIYKDPRVTGHKVTGPEDLKKKLQELLKSD